MDASGFESIVAVLAIVAVAAAGPALAIAFLARMRSREKALKRSPLNHKLLRQAGEHTRGQYDEAIAMVLGRCASAGTLSAGLAIGVAVSRGMVDRWWLNVGVAALVLVAGLVLIFRTMREELKRVWNLRLGYEAEQAMGQALNELMLDGAHVFHDFPADGFNIDHIVVSAAGVVAVETKGYSKPNFLPGKEAALARVKGDSIQFPARIDHDAIPQARRQAKALEKWIRDNTGHSVPVRAALALPGWFVESDRKSDVKVIIAPWVKDLIKVIGSAHLTEQQIADICRQIRKQCTDVAPVFSRS
jgi:hypothetical protein